MDCCSNEQSMRKLTLMLKVQHSALPASLNSAFADPSATLWCCSVLFDLKKTSHLFSGGPLRLNLLSLQENLKLCCKSKI